ncbi:hypothetical protein BH23GEM3_BH23GEM3_02700 [soil metagenome]
MHAGIRSVAVMLFIVVQVACAGRTPEQHTVQGECSEVYGANVCTWATMDGKDAVIEFGATIPLAVAERAPHEMEMAWPPVANAVVRMPAAVAAATGVDHLTIYWEPHGHPPGAYLTPHFDFHFYNISTATRVAIDCTDATKPAVLPADYGMIDLEVPELGVLVGLCVPEMGMHTLLASELQSDQIFDGTMVIGFYHGSPIFFEPMIARDMLMRRQSFELPMPAVSGLPAGVRYPQRFRAEYDAAGAAYRFIFSGI